MKITGVTTGSVYDGYTYTGSAAETQEGQDGMSKKMQKAIESYTAI